MENTFTIVVAERNHRIRSFLCRELSAEGYGTEPAADCLELIEKIACCNADLVILDPDLPNLQGLDLQDLLADREPEFPILVHCFNLVQMNGWRKVANTIFIERRGDNLDAIKLSVNRTLHNYYPERAAGLAFAPHRPAEEARNQ